MEDVKRYKGRERFSGQEIDKEKNKEGNRYRSVGGFLPSVRHTINNS